MISIPVMVHNNYFRWQTSLFWYNHKKTYGSNASRLAEIAIMKRNHYKDPIIDTLQWDMQTPHSMCDAWMDHLPISRVIELSKHLEPALVTPINIQIALDQILTRYAGDQIVEILDGDMFHFRPAPSIVPEADELIVCDLYEEWHLKSKSDHLSVISPYTHYSNDYYNGGFVPIVGRVKTLARILPDWIDMHERILLNPHDDVIKWWAGMYSLQIACEINEVRMTAQDWCYIPGLNQLQDHHYISHYTIDGRFNKKNYPTVDTSQFESNVYYERILDWMTS